MKLAIQGRARCQQALDAAQMIGGNYKNDYVSDFVASTIREQKKWKQEHE